jgi:hypothetical protein
MAREVPPTETAPEPLPSVAEQLGELEILIDTAKMVVTDLKLLARARRGEIGDEEAVDFLERIVVGGVSVIPFEALGQVWGAVYAAVYGKGRAKN